MALGRNRKTIFVKGLGKLEIRKVEPTPADSLFSEAGYIDSTKITEIPEMEEIVVDTGELIDMIPKQISASWESILTQTSIDEISLIRNSIDQYHAIRYSGLASESTFQYFLMEYAKIIPRLDIEFKVGKRVLPIRILGLKQDNLGYDVPVLFVYETAKEIKTNYLSLWITARAGLNAGTSRLLDVSGYAQHGTLNSDYSTIWQTGTTPERFLRFDGTNDYCSLGDILDDDGTTDFMIEAWVRIQGANGSLQEILAKKTATGTSAGYGFYRNASNYIAFHLASGSAEAINVSSSTLLINTWAHIACTIDRNGSGQIYINGSANGSPVSVAAIGSGANALNLYIGRDNTNYGQVDIGAVRIYRYPTVGLPSDISTIISNHYNAEKTFYGL